MSKIFFFYQLFLDKYFLDVNRIKYEVLIEKEPRNEIKQRGWDEFSLDIQWKILSDYVGKNEAEEILFSSYWLFTNSSLKEKINRK